MTLPRLNPGAHVLAATFRNADAPEPTAVYVDGDIVHTLERGTDSLAEMNAAFSRAGNAMDILRSAAEGAREEDDRDAGYGTVEIVLLVVVVVLALVGAYYLIKTN